MRRSPFSETLSHPGDPLPLHLLRVAEQASASLGAGARGEARLIAYLAGLFHDLGKATPHFQQYLRTGRKTRFTPHARVGAVLAWWYTAEAGLPLWVRLAVLIAICRHHGALNQDDWGQLLLSLREDFRGGDPVLAEQLSSLDLEGIGRWLGERLPGKVAGYPLARPTSLTPEAVGQAVLGRQGAGLRDLRRAFPGLDEALVFLAGFGGLLAADKVDAATQGSELPRRGLPAGAVAAYKAARFSGPASALDERRERIAGAVERTWLGHPEDRLFTLTSPTGSGKTLAVLNAALAMREAARGSGVGPRIIYCLPFTSVIDQNHEVFRAVLRAGGAPDREDVLLKHHHLVEGLYRTEGPRGETVEHQPDGAGQLLTETWQSEVVVTTFYQLLHSLLSRRNGNLKRAGQLSGSLVLMDEVQAVPLRYWRALRHLFQSAARALGTRFVLLTATRPLIFRSEEGDAVELLPDHEEHFRALSRVRLHCRHREPVSLAAFGEHLAAVHASDLRPTLVILNRTAAVGELFSLLRAKLPGRKLVALSTRFTPRDRRARIRLVRRLLRAGEPCILVSTQLIEAGVDVSFPVVHRDLGPLDSVIQSAGRCNRHGAGDVPGEVHLWRLVSTKADGGPGAPLWQRVYDSALVEATTEVLGEREVWEEAEFLDLSRRYFEACWQRHDQEPVDEALAAGDFGRVESSFRLIEDGPPTRSLFVVARRPNGELRPQDEALWERYRDIQAAEDLTPADKDRRFRVLRRAFYERVVQVYGPPDPDEPIERLDATEGTYTRETGFVGLPREEASCIF